MTTMYNARTELVPLSAIETGDTLIDGSGREWFHVREIRVSGHAPVRRNRLVLSGINGEGLTYSHSALMTSLVRRVAH